MVTVRSFTNPIEASLAKSVLDNYEIPCALLHENSNLYTRGAQFAVPVELVVDEQHVERAVHILNADFEDLPDITPFNDVPEASADITSDDKTQNPWELLLLAFYLLVPAICLLAIKFPQISASPRIRNLIARASVTQFLAFLELLLALSLVGLYFVVRRSKRQT